MTEEEYERSQLLNELFHLAGAQGLPEADLATEFRTSTGEELIARYCHLLPADSPFRLMPASHKAHEPAPLTINEQEQKLGMRRD